MLEKFIRKCKGSKEPHSFGKEQGWRVKTKIKMAWCGIDESYLTRVGIQSAVRTETTQKPDQWGNDSRPNSHGWGMGQTLVLVTEVSSKWNNSLNMNAKIT